VPYATPQDLRAGLGRHSSARRARPPSSYTDGHSRGGGLGLINETDAWLTGRPYGLPGTVAIRYNSDGASQLRGSGGFGDDGSSGVAEVLRQILDVEKESTKATKRIAFWVAAMGGLTVAGILAGVSVKLADKIEIKRRRSASSSSGAVAGRRGR
jgi:hypothetical protein